MNMNTNIGSNGYSGTDSANAAQANELHNARFPRSQRMTVLNGMLWFVLILVVLQLWLLTATMNAYLGGDDSVVWPAAIASAICFALNVGLLWYMKGLEKR